MCIIVLVCCLNTRNSTRKVRHILMWINGSSRTGLRWHRSWDTPQCVTCCRVGACLLPSICHTLSQERGGDATARPTVTGEKGLHFLTNVTASSPLLSSPWSAAQTLSGVFLGRMSVFLRSTLDAGEVKKGWRRGSTSFLLTHTISELLSHSFLFVSHTHTPLCPVSACWDATRPRCYPPAPPRASSPQFSVSLSQVQKVTLPCI